MGNSSSAELRDRVKSTTQLSESQKREINELIQEISNLRNQVGHLTGSLEGANEQIVALKEEKDTLNDRLDVLNKKLMSESKRSSEFEGNLRVTRMNNDGIKQEFENLKQRFGHNTCLKAEVDVTNSALKQEVENLKKRNEQLDSQVELLTNNLDDYIEKFTSLTAESNFSAAEVKNLNELKQILQDLNHRREEQIKKIETAHTKMIEDRASLAKEVEGLKILKATLDVEAESKKTEIQDLKREKTELEKKFEKRENKLSELHEQQMKQATEQSNYLIKHKSDDHRFVLQTFGSNVMQMMEFFGTQRDKEREASQMMLNHISMNAPHDQSQMRPMIAAGPIVSGSATLTTPEPRKPLSSSSGDNAHSCVGKEAGLIVSGSATLTTSEPRKPLSSSSGDNAHSCVGKEESP